MTRRQQWVRVAFYLGAIAWLNLYICRELFFAPSVHTNSMHGFWIALASRAGESWWHPMWWPYWDAGIPFEFTYAPLVPALIHAWSGIASVPELIAFQTITAIVYTLLPMTLLFAAWRLTGAAGYSFAAAVFYSLTAPANLLAPDQAFHWSGFWDSRRAMLATCWDETPHLAALAILPLTILLLARSIETGRRRYFAAAALSIAVATYASAFAPMMVAMASICLVAALNPKEYKRNAARIITVGIAAYAAVAAFLPPSLIGAMRADSKDEWHGGQAWNASSFTALAIVVFGFTLLCLYLPRWTRDWRLRFFAFFAYLTSSVPVMAQSLHRQLLPQPVRYKFEMEMALALLVVFGARHWFERMPVPLKRAAIFLLIALAVEQVIHFRQDMRAYIARLDLGATVEARASEWAGENLRGVRVMLPGSVAQWASAFSDVAQFSGSSWSMALNRVQQRGLQAIYFGDAGVTLAWLRAFGVGAVGISSTTSDEYWKGFAHPAKFDGVLPAIWSDRGVTIYRVPRRSDSLAHVVPESALVRHAPRAIDDLAEIEKYDAALEDALLPSAPMEWEGRNRIRIHAKAFAGEAISVQVTYHPGWRGVANGRPTAIFADGLGLMWLRPECNGACEIQLDYDGGFELRVCRYVSAAAILLLIALFVWPG